MPPASSENDLKRLARRRLIGAVALTLLAVIVLPLLLEDEPPPASSLSVKMAAAPQPALDPDAGVHLAALSDPIKADALKGRAVLAGLPAYTDKLGNLTRVRVGPFPSHEAAETAMKKLT